MFLTPSDVERLPETEVVGVQRFKSFRPPPSVPVEERIVQDEVFEFGNATVTFEALAGEVCRCSGAGPGEVLRFLRSRDWNGSFFDAWDALAERYPSEGMNRWLGVPA